MIFVTVGAQMPFDRLVSAVDRWAANCGRDDVLAQIGPTNWRPSRIRWVQWLDPGEFRRHFEDASVVVAHAGMGSIITALDLGKPILVMPRRAELNETRNDHQVATARRFLQLGRVAVASDEDGVGPQLDRLTAASTTNQLTSSECSHFSSGCPLKGTDGCNRFLDGQACPNLLRALRAFIDG